MSDSYTHEQSASEIRRSVSDDNRFQLPEHLVREIAYEGITGINKRGPKVTWYYHEAHEKAVLSDETGNRPSLKPVGDSGLSGFSLQEFEAGEFSGARVTLITELPDELYEKLTRGDVILNPVYPEHPQLNSTYVSVYPAETYLRGELPNVIYERIPRGDDEPQIDENAHQVGHYRSHANSI